MDKLHSAAIYFDTAGEYISRKSPSYEGAVVFSTEAKHVLEKALAEVCLRRGYTLNKLGKLAEALEDCTKAIELDPEHTAVYGNRGFALDGLGRREEAVGNFHKSIELGMKNKNRNAIQYSSIGVGKAFGYLAAIKSATSPLMFAI